MTTSNEIRHLREISLSLKDIAKTLKKKDGRSNPQIHLFYVDKYGMIRATCGLENGLLFTESWELTDCSHCIALHDNRK